MNLNQAIEKAALEFGICFPLPRTEFLKIRAKILLESHPDKQGESYDAGKLISSLEMFKVIMENFDEANGFVDVGEVNGVRTRSGDLISELGKGLGNLTNGTSCSECKGQGYTVNQIPIYTTNHHCVCEHGFIFKDSCRACSGTGRFKTRSGFVVKCKTYSGTGTHIYKKPRLCPMCNGFWMFWGERVTGYKKELHTCLFCRGKGEVEIYNPVFQKGSMQIKELSRKKSIPSVDINVQRKKFQKLMSKVANDQKEKSPYKFPVWR